MNTTSSEITYRWQFHDQEGRDITSELHAKQDATEARAYEGAHGDLLLVAAARTPRGRWRIDTTDRYEVPVSAYNKRFAGPPDTLQYLAGRSGDTLREAVCRCGQGEGECD